MSLPSVKLLSRAQGLRRGHYAVAGVSAEWEQGAHLPPSLLRREVVLERHLLQRALGHAAEGREQPGAVGQVLDGINGEGAGAGANSPSVGKGTSAGRADSVNHLQQHGTHRWRWRRRWW